MGWHKNRKKEEISQFSKRGTLGNVPANLTFNSFKAFLLLKKTLHFYYYLVISSFPFIP
jgi:hypothetical protein